MNVLGKSAIKKGVNFQKAVPLRLFTRSTTRLFQQNHYCPIHDNRRTSIRNVIVRGFCCLLETLLMIYLQGGPYYSHLHNVLGAYVCYRPDLGYVQV